jgi:hypothetical protein
MDAISIFQQPVPLSLGGFGGDPVSWDPNAYWDEAQSKYQCKVGYAFNDSLGACVAVAGAPTGAETLPIDPTGLAQQVCAQAGLYWDAATGQCLQSAPAPATPPVIIPGTVPRPGIPPPPSVPVPVPRLPPAVTAPPAPMPAPPPQTKQAGLGASTLTWLIVGSVAVIGIAALAKRGRATPNRRRR